MELNELKAQMQKALADGDDAKFWELHKAVGKLKSEAMQFEVKRQQEEDTKLSGARLKLASRILKDNSAREYGSELVAVKAAGFTYKLPYEGSDIPTVALLVPSVKTARGGTTGGGKTKDELGMSLGEVFDKFATDQERTKLATAASGSAQWQVKVAVKKRAIKDNLIAPAK